jgi:uncharacterized repeat protein (TIGR01451 family)
VVVTLPAGVVGYGTAGRASVAHAAGAVAVSVASSPQRVASGQAMAYTITVANPGSAQATGLTLTDTITDLVPAAPETVPFFRTSSGSCAYDSATSLVACTAAALPAGGVWTATIIAQVTAAPGTVLPDTATVTGTESGRPVTGSGSVTTTIAPSLPPGFAQTRLTGGLSKPVAIAFPPGSPGGTGGSGDVWIGEQGGTIMDFHGGVLRPTPVVTLPNTYSSGENGLLGIAFDPSYATNGYVYVSYTVSTTNSSGTVVPYTRLSRFTAFGGTINPATEKVLLQGNQVQGGHHPGNDLQVGPDGKLWWSVGDNVPAISNGQTLGNVYGKIIRLGLDGSVPSDNPFVNVPAAVGGIYGYGLRNPYRFTFLPTGAPMVANTGSNYWESLDTINSGSDYGWPYFEGDCFSCGFANPDYAYGHYPVDAAASAIAAYRGGTFPAAYDHVVFVGDYNRRDIEAISFDPSYQTESSATVFDTSAGTISDLVEGPDGNLYFTGVFEGTLTEITAPGPFGPGSVPPPGTPPQPSAAPGGPTATITAPSTYNAGDTISFLGTATDPAAGPLPAHDYTWQVDFVSHGLVQPSYYAEIPYPFDGPQAGITSGTFTIPTDPSQVPGSYYQITLTVTDSQGLRTVVTKTLRPNLTSWTVTDPVAGAGYFVDGAWHRSSYTSSDVVGVRHILTGLGLAQVINGTRYRFSGWGDGSALTDTFTSGATPGTFTPEFDQVTHAMPPGWAAADIGAPITAGTADYAAGSRSFYLDGAGADEWGANDQSHYVYQTLAGDGSIVARVRFQTNSSPWAKAGLMIRPSTASGAPFADAFVTPDVPSATPDVAGTGCDANGCLAPGPPALPVAGYGALMQDSASASATGPTVAGYTAPDKWLKLVRTGSTFTSYESADGATWTRIGVQAVSMTGPVDIGLFDTGHNVGEVSTAAFDNVSVAPATSGPVVGGLAVYVGYAEDKEINNPDPAAFPVPWAGAPNTTFLGGTVPGQSACGTLAACYDGGAIRLDNPGTTPVTVSSVSVDDHSSVPGGKVFSNLWGGFTVQPGKSVILTANPPADNPGYDNFDTSGYPNDNCTPLTVAPTVTITVNGIATTLADSTHVLDTGGIDRGSCSPKENESIQWRPIGASGGNDATLTIAPGDVTVTAGQPVTETVTLLDGGGAALPNAVVHFTVTSGPDTGLKASVPTNSAGHATFVLPAASDGTDIVAASVTTVGTFTS